MKKLRLQLEDLAVESFATAEEKAGRGTVGAHNSCDTCVDLNCSADCTGLSCPDTGTGTGPGTGTTPCGPGGSDPIFGCGSDHTSCNTMFEWTGCDISCVFFPCNSHHPEHC